MKNCISRRSFLKAAGILGAAGAPVSYTHLDVYKRQILYVPWTLSAYSLLFFQMSVLRFLFPPRRAGRTGRLCGCLLYTSRCV